METHEKKIHEILKEQGVDQKSGLTNKEAKGRLEKFGRNELVAKTKISPLKIFISQFKSFIIYILLFAVTISVIAKEYVDASVILIILLFNSFFGFFQEYKAEKAIDALKRLSGFQVRTLRSGKETVVDTSEIVPGDIILLEAGSKVPADARIVEAIDLEVSEASLTGESLPVSKHGEEISGKVALAAMKNMVFSGTSITKGRAKAVVIQTGMKTQIGNIAEMVSEVKDEITPLQRNLESLGRWVGLITIGICIVVFFTGIIKEDIYLHLLKGNYFDFILASKTWFLTAVSLAVAAVPEGLPIVVTIALAMGTRKLLKRKVLIRRLPSVETLGETSIICTDKTGTITRNQMTVRSAYINNREIEFSGRGYSLEGAPSKPLTTGELLLFRIGVLCNNASLEKENGVYKPSGDPTEVAFYVSAAKAGLDFKKLKETWKILDEKTFDSYRKLMSTIVVDPKNSKKQVFTKGAPENVLEKCTKILVNGRVIKLSLAEKKRILEKNDGFAKRSLRVLGFAYKPYLKEEKDFEKDLIFVGLQAMMDPPHKEVPEAIKRCREAGIRVVMMTGDNLHTAVAIGKEIGLKEKAIVGSEFEALSLKEKVQAVKEISIFARVEPSHKLEIVRLLQDRGLIVAMTGDGVNDAPAVKHANLGIAMGLTGSDVTKESSEMILQNDNFANIVEAVEEGRGIYENIKKFVNYLFSSNIAEVLIVFMSIVLGWDLPLTAIMLLWINLVTDGLPALALSVDPSPKNIMQNPPRKSNEGIMTKKMTTHILFVSALITIGVLWLFQGGLQYGLAKAQTIAFTALIIMELVRLQTIRSESRVGIFANKYLIIAVIASLGLQLLVIYSPLHSFFGTVALNLKDWTNIIGVSIGVWIINSIGVKTIGKIFAKK